MTVDLFRNESEIALGAFMSAPGLTGTVSIYDPHADAFLDTVVPSAVTGKPDNYRAIWNYSGVTLPDTSQLEAHWLMDNGEEAFETINVRPAGVEESIDALLARLGELGLAPALIQADVDTFVGQYGYDIVCPTGLVEADLVGATDVRMRFQRISPPPAVKNSEEVLAAIVGTDVSYKKEADDQVYLCGGKYRRQGMYKLATGEQRFTPWFDQKVFEPLPPDLTPPP